MNWDYFAIGFEHPGLEAVPRGRRGFTLIELLVVIAVIAVLIGILVPSLANARRVTRQVACASNLRQLGLATRMYADAYDDFLPRRGQGVGVTVQITRPTDWFNALPVIMGQRPYMDLAAAGKVPRPGDNSCLACPEADDNGKPNFWSFGMNMWLSVWNNSALDLPDKFGGVGPPETMVLLADGPSSHCSVSPAPAPEYDYSPVARHNGRVNICFLDGHVDTLPGSYVGCGLGFVEHSDIRWRVPGSAWDSAQH